MVWSYGMQYPFGLLGSAVPAVSPPSRLLIPSLLAIVETGKGEKAVTQGWLSSSQNASVIGAVLATTAKHSAIELL